MELDYNPSTKAFVVKVPRKGADLQSLMRDHGLDFSLPASTSDTAVLFTREPYCAATFWEYATPAAKGELGGIYNEIQASWKKESSVNFACPPDKELWPYQ